MLVVVVIFLHKSINTARSASGQCVALHTALLQSVGFMRWRGGDGGAGRSASARLHAAYRALVLAVTLAYLLQECVFAYQERNDMAKFSRVMFLLLCHITSIAKQIVFHYDADRIQDMIQSLNGKVVPFCIFDIKFCKDFVF